MSKWYSKSTRRHIPPPVVPPGGQTLNYYSAPRRQSALKRFCNHVRYEYAGPLGGALAIGMYLLLIMTVLVLRLWASFNGHP